MKLNVLSLSFKFSLLESLLSLVIAKEKKQICILGDTFTRISILQIRTFDHWVRYADNRVGVRVRLGVRITKSVRFRV